MEIAQSYCFFYRGIVSLATTSILVFPPFFAKRTTLPESPIGELPAMKNLGRVIRLALHYRFTFLASIVSALMVGILWGGNIGVVFPIIEVAFKNESPQKWIASEIAAANAKITEKQAEIADLKTQLAAAGGDEIRRLEKRIVADENGRPMLADPEPTDPQIQINAEARAYLDSTDWYVIRQQETGQEIPAEILTKRQEARDSIV